ncbi:hypothetical protein OPV22_009505 [Ensete ventricosum]|uniref:Pentatricopeptide repeat-containing protein-mitochondrial domain-containing protein n=1 Tax=Ensete ventricosum TaxID=4639 RepID=A0AAV8R5B3_ENSVE|nr:hypothetical protein OPV22_009505 [Ensete ventricosum]
MGGFSHGRNEAAFIQGVCAIVSKGNWRTLWIPHVSDRFTTSNVHQILLQLSADTALSWNFFKWAQSLPHYHHSLPTDFTMVHLLTRSRRFQEARNLLQKFAFKGFLSSPTVLGALLSGHGDQDSNSQILSWLVFIYSRSNKTQDAIQILELMKARGLKLDPHACSALLSALAKARLTATAWNVYNDILRMGLVANVHILNVMIHVCFKSGDTEKAEKLVSEMDGKVKGNMDFAWKLRNKMLESGLVLDQFTYKALIHGFCKVQELDEAKEVLLDMLDAGFAPNYSTYSWLVDSYCSLNNVEAVLSIPDEIAHRGLSVDKSLYRALIRRLCKRGLVDFAQKALNKMLEKGLLGDSLVYGNLAYAYLSTGKQIVACQILNEMVKKQLMITAKVYKSLCASLANDRGILDFLWSHAIERGLIARNVYKLIQEAKLSSQNDTLNVSSPF